MREIKEIPIIIKQDDFSLQIKKKIIFMKNTRDCRIPKDLKKSICNNKLSFKRIYLNFSRLSL